MDFLYVDSPQVWLLIKGGLYAGLKLDAKFLRVACNVVQHVQQKDITII